MLSFVFLVGDLMLDVVSLWFGQLGNMELHSYINCLLSSGVGLFLLIPVGGAICVALYQVIRR